MTQNWLMSDRAIHCNVGGYLFYWMEIIFISFIKKSVHSHVTSLNLGTLINGKQ